MCLPFWVCWSALWTRGPPGCGGLHSEEAGHHRLGGGLCRGCGWPHHHVCADTLLPGPKTLWVVLGPHLPAWEAQYPPERKDCLLPLRNSSLKSPEEFGQADCGSPEEERTSSGWPREGCPGHAGRPSYSACNHLCSLFIFCGPSFKALSRILSAWGYSVWPRKEIGGHNLKTGQKRTAKGGLPVYLDKVCALVGVWAQVCVVVFCHSWMPGCVSF